MVTAHSEERKFACTYCNFRAKISVVLKRHIKRLHHNELNFVCDICGKKFFEAYRLKIHEETHVKEKKRKTAAIEVQNETCDICHQSFLGNYISVANSHTVWNFAKFCLTLKIFP